jgi:DNA-binding SARP family transcriptional activator
LVAQHASRIYIRTLGSFGVFRSSWKGPELAIDRKNPKALLGLLIAAADTALARDQVMDRLWPDSAPAAASNSLNQTVFQLRRAFAVDTSPGDDPPYLLATTDSLRLQPQLVITDLAEFRRLSDSAQNAGSAAAWTSAVATMIDLIRGDFLGDLRYEDWAAEAQPRIHAEIRHTLLPIALGRGTYAVADLGIRAASALTALDPFDEQAYLAIADRLAESGRRVAARELITRYARKLRSELDEPPSTDLLSALTSLGAASIDI